MAIIFPSKLTAVQVWIKLESMCEQNFFISCLKSIVAWISNNRLAALYAAIPWDIDLTALYTKRDWNQMKFL